MSFHQHVVTEPAHGPVGKLPEANRPASSHSRPRHPAAAGASTAARGPRRPRRAPRGGASDRPRSQSTRCQLRPASSAQRRDRGPSASQHASAARGRAHATAARCGGAGVLRTHNYDGTSGARREHARVGRRAQAAIEDHTESAAGHDRRRAAVSSGSSARMVPDADRDRVDFGALSVDAPVRPRAGQGRPDPRRRRHAAVER